MSQLNKLDVRKDENAGQLVGSTGQRIDKILQSGNVLRFQTGRKYEGKKVGEGIFKINSGLEDSLSEIYTEIFREAISLGADAYRLAEKEGNEKVKIVFYGKD